jgi:hypothetical protein
MLPPGATPGLPAVAPDTQFPLHCGLLATDTETGGLDPRLHPLLSVSAVAATSAVEEIDGLSLKVLPPHGTLLEIPRAEHCWVPSDELRNREFIGYLDVWSKKVIPAQEVDAAHVPCLITSQAAEINGYITRSAVSGHPWDLGAVQNWHDQALPIKEAEDTLIRLIRQCFITKPIPVAHNAPFDDKFVYVWMRRFYDELGKVPDGAEWCTIQCRWLCTMSALGRYLKATGQPMGKGARKLATLVKLAGVDQEAAHDALADARSSLIGLRWLRDKPGVF